MDKYYLSIDIGGTYVKFAYINQKLEIKMRKKIPSPKTLNELYDAISTAVSESSFMLSGIGISTPGSVNFNTGTVYYGGSHPYLHEVSLKKFVENEFDIDCVVSNDGKSAVTTELWLGNLNGVRNGAAIVLGTGVGGGIVLEGKVFQGSHYQAGELSFMLNTTNLNGKMHSFMGKSASAVNFIKEASSILHYPGSTDGEKVFKQICNHNNSELIKLFKNYCREIACIIINLQAVLDLSKVVIGGGISAQDILIESIIDEYKNIRSEHEQLKNTLQEIEIEKCAYSNDSNLYGAIYSFLKHEKIDIPNK